MQNRSSSRNTLLSYGKKRGAWYLEPGLVSSRIKRQMIHILRAALVRILVRTLISPRSSSAYAMLAHGAIIDATWETHIKPLLRARFPGSTEDQLSETQAYVYGGSIIQDMGYYPYGSHFFSDLTHDVRSSDFIQALLRDAKDLDEYAFAVGRWHAMRPAK